MSYILEALKKAEQERSLGGVPDISADHELLGRSGKGRSWLWIGLAVLLVNGLFIGLFLQWQQSSRVTSVQPRGVASETVPPSVPESQAPVSAPQPPVMATPQTVLPAAPAIASAEPDTSTVAAVNPPAVVEPRPMPMAPARPKPEPPLAPVVAPVEEPVVVNTVYLDWRDASPQVQQLVAGLSLDVHVYADRPVQRFVLIDMEKYREGDRISAGPVLEEINEQGMVLFYQGERFQVDRQ